MKIKALAVTLLLLAGGPAGAATTFEAADTSGQGANAPTWVLYITGFAFVGAAMRRQRQAAPPAARAGRSR